MTYNDPSTSFKAKDEMSTKHPAIRQALRWIWMLTGMTVLACGIRLQVLASLGLGPWDVLHMGLSMDLPITFGQASQLVGLVLVAGAWLMGEPPRVGTLLNMWYVGAVYDVIAANRLLPEPQGAPAAWIWLLAGIALLAGGSAWYLSADLGAGPRDGMTLALARRIRRRWPGSLAQRGGSRSEPGVGPARVLLEGSATLTGYLLGGPVGIGSVVVAALVGPAMAFAIPRFSFARRWWAPASPHVYPAVNAAPAASMALAAHGGTAATGAGAADRAPGGVRRR